MKCLLIGGAGFLGSWLTKYLTHKAYKVIIIDPLIDYGVDSLQVKKVRDFRNKQLLKNATFYKGTFEEIGDRVMKKEKPDVVIHLAGYPLDYKFDSPVSLEYLTADISLTHNILVKVKKYNVKKFIFISSVFAYGEFDYSIPECTPLDPKTVYGVSKASSEFLIKSYLNNWVIVRTTNVYGFGDIHNRSVNTVINKAYNNKKFWVNEETELDFIHVEDLIRGIYKTIKLSPMKEVFHISGGNPQKLSTLVKYLKPHFKLQYEIRHLSDRPIRGIMNNSKAKKMLGWSPKIGLEKGINDYLKYVSKYRFA